MTAPTTTGHVFGRLIIGNALVWAATMLAAAVVAKASDEFIYLLLVLIVGASVSGWVIEGARRQLMPSGDRDRSGDDAPTPSR